MTKNTTVPANNGLKFAAKPPQRLLCAGLWALLTICLTASSAKAVVLFSNLVSFNVTNGATPSAQLVQGTDGNFYGVTPFGGTNSSGTAFQMSSNNYSLTTLVTFKFTNGYQPNSLMQGNDGNFYGTTTFGGTNNSLDTSGYGFGTIFEFTTNGSFTSLFSFAGTNGTSPVGLVQNTNGTFYGTLKNGNPSENPLNSFANNTYGGLFTFGVGHTPTNLFFFSNANGANPTTALLPGTNGIYYGSTLGGGASGVGSLFDFTSAGLFTNLDSFSGPTGYSPVGLIAGKDGNIYGTTGGGSMAQGTAPGTIFKLKYDGTLSTVTVFNMSNGFGATCLIQAADGNFYGTASQGGAYSNGTVFEYSTNNVLSTIYSFTGGVDGGNPTSIMQAKDGNFYGTTAYGGTFADGNIFKLSIVPVPSFKTVTKTNGTISFTWAAAAGHSYEVQYSTNLSHTNWINLKSVNTTNTVGNTTDTPGTDTKRFYRILLLM